MSFRTPLPRSPHVAIIGGGMAGLSCALELAKAHSIRSTVFDTGEHGVGGRLGTRAGGDGSLRRPDPPPSLAEALLFDHAAQFFTAADPRFAAMVAGWEAAGAVTRWTGLLARLALAADGSFAPLPAAPGETDAVRYVGVGGMRQMASFLAAAAQDSGLVEVRSPLWVDSVKADAGGGGWRVAAKRADQGTFSAVVIAHNGKCANRLAAPMGAPGVLGALRRLKLSANWALMVGFEGTVGVPWEGAFFDGSEVLAWAGNNSAKLGGGAPTPGGLQCWTLLSTQRYGRANKVPQEAVPPETAAQVTAAMLEEFSRAVGGGGALPPAVFTKTQLWGAALPQNAPILGGEACIWDATARVGVVGDWVGGGASVEAAALSGAAMAARIAAEARGEGPGSCGLGAEFVRIRGEEIGMFPATARR